MPIQKQQCVADADAFLLRQAMDIEYLLSRFAYYLDSFSSNYSTTNLTLPQRRVCFLLEAGPLTLTAISKELRMSGSATTQIADRLEKSGIVERLNGGLSDRRCKRLQLTREGAKCVRLQREQRIQRAIAILTHLSPDARCDVLRVLNALLSAKDKD